MDTLLHPLAVILSFPLLFPIEGPHLLEPNIRWIYFRPDSIDANRTLTHTLYKFSPNLFGNRFHTCFLWVFDLTDGYY